jgi:hypothetical protein
MRILQTLIAAFSRLVRSRQSVRDHDKRQAYGPRWSLRRSRRIDGYARKRPRRGWWFS